MPHSSPYLSGESTTSAAPRLSGQLPGPIAQRIIAEDDALISPSYTRSYPLVVKRGYGCRIVDVDENEFLDFTAGIAVNSTGHCHPEVVRAIQEQANSLIHMSGTDFYYEQMTLLARRLSDIAPMRGPHRFYFGNSGAEAVECALKLARYHTGRPNIISFLGSFHGRTMGALSLTASKIQQKRRFAPFIPGTVHVPYPNSFRDCLASGSSREQIGRESAQFIEEKLFRATLPPEEVAAIIVEPIQGEGGYLVAPSSFLRELRSICDRHGILLIADEIQSGVARTGKWWAIQHSGVEPDIVCIAKGIASGMPLGVCMARASVMNWKPGSHASTFGGNPVCIAAALATLNILEKEGLENAASVGRAMMSRLQPWTSCYPFIGDVRGRGLMIGIEIVQDRRLNAPAPDLRDRLVELAFRRGLLLLGCGETTLRICPPLIITPEEADAGLNILERCFAEAERHHACPADTN